jgi:hypothetical protein
MLSLTWGFANGCVRWSRALSDPVVVRFGGQRRRAIRPGYHSLAGPAALSEPCRAQRRWQLVIMLGQVHGAAAVAEIVRHRT